MKRVAVFVLVGSALALASWSVSADVVPSVEAPLFGMWNRLNANVEHEVMHFWVEGSTWAGRYDKHPEPGLGFPNPPEGTSGDFRGADATNFVCEPTFPFYPCQNVVKVVEGTTQYKPPRGSPFEVLERHIVVREANGQEVMWQYWVRPGNLICPWYRSFDEALAAKPFRPNGDCIVPVQRSRSNPQPPQPAASAATVAAQHGGIPAGSPSKSSSAARSRDERFLALLATPEGHAQLLNEGKQQLRRHYPDLAKQLHLTAEQEDQVLSVEAEQTLKNEARRARCRLDPSCNVQSLPIDLESQQKAIKELLGAEKFDEYERYQQTLYQRLEVHELRSRLDVANVLSDEKAEALIAALYEEGERYAAEAKAMGRQCLWFSSGGLRAAYDGTRDPPLDAEVLSSAQEFARRVRDRAAEVLTAEQMRKFEEIQEEQLAQVSAVLRSQADWRASGQ